MDHPIYICRKWELDGEKGINIKIEKDDLTHAQNTQLNKIKILLILHSYPSSLHGPIYKPRNPKMCATW